MDASGDAPKFHVVRNAEDQYSIWPADRTIPAGWFTVGVSGIQDECLAYIETAWTDIRPRSVRGSGPTVGELG